MKHAHPARRALHTIHTLIALSALLPVMAPDVVQNPAGLLPIPFRHTNPAHTAPVILHRQPQPADLSPQHSIHKGSPNLTGVRTVILQWKGVSEAVDPRGGGDKGEGAPLSPPPQRRPQGSRCRTSTATPLKGGG